MTIQTSIVLGVQSEIISGLTLILEGIATAPTADDLSREISVTALDHILLCFQQLGAMLDARGQPLH